MNRAGFGPGRAPYRERAQIVMHLSGLYIREDAV
jgi:hypothetical protein